MSRSRKSSIWNYFTISDREKGVAMCNLCEKQFSFKTTTSNLKKHLTRSNHALHLNLDSGEAALRPVEFIELDGLPDEVNEAEEAERGEQVNRCQLVIEEGVIPQGQTQPDDILDISNNTFNALQAGDAAADQVNLDLRQAFQNGMQGIDNITEADFSGKIAETPQQHAVAQKQLPKTTLPRLRPAPLKLGNSVSSSRVAAADSCTDKDFELFGRHVGNQLRKLSKVNSFLAQDEIQSILTRYRIYESMSEGNRRTILANVEK
ncbi:hypothetical protein LSTR_LSTR010658 [Laodelphax striatellus]|uniref:BED-type domain-containing protein n=1 Tax=Laodelphax striatellus TaxID=195883 RepID=A0A482WSJ5_LAOST|nr:hypothetical protein LSTR_LSTR010658 [Laodelphax striatellus]